MKEVRGLLEGPPQLKYAAHINDTLIISYVVVFSNHHSPTAVLLIDEATYSVELKYVHATKK